MSSITSHEQPNTNPDIDLIMAIHRYKRPKGSRTEQAFIDAYLKPLGVKDDAFGNLHLTIGEDPSILWSSHTDTVHTDEGMQQVVLSGNILGLKKKTPSNCLGADDGAGIFIMMEMIKARIPGMYIFHYGEEKGCEGSTALAKNTPELLKGIKAAIAFDRKGFGDIITFMGGERVCSEAFATSLAAQLPTGYKSDPSGMRTDVKLYERLIPECTNISVGYTGPHSNTENLNVKHLIEVRNAMMKFDQSKLVISRDPSVVERRYSSPSTTTTHSGGRTSYAPTGFYYGHTIADICEKQHNTIAKMLAAAGVTFDQLAHLMMEVQKEQTEPKSYKWPHLIPPIGWVDPYAPPVEEKKAEVAETASTAAPEADKTLATVPAGNGSNARVNVSNPPQTPTKDVSPHHISNPGASDAVAGRGSGTPLRTGNPALDGVGSRMGQHG